MTGHAYDNMVRLTGIPVHHAYASFLVATICTSSLPLPRTTTLLNHCFIARTPRAGERSNESSY
ncbi:hypothetical protein BAUCODRAFT_35008 [Baudoinia panamericana UAMH 10762]|uniref:Uncharacterized protein n=1 Tax=Baudoinia panamericana (strain UAMH 10762) TaxID=717646 RepID=M2N7I1_BAUPA|nr:uncharacterized protein BAUCODRAFT_35008 [Baudoinia panamericana UAMH 10762]EMC95014.1 hypothetical protein BAUCODRAFT_35008 [Baudoinia panamericana UAMH 10762]